LRQDEPNLPTAPRVEAQARSSQTVWCPHYVRVAPTCDAHRYAQLLACTVVVAFPKPTTHRRIKKVPIACSRVPWYGLRVSTRGVCAVLSCCLLLSPYGSARRWDPQGCDSRPWRPLAGLPAQVASQLPSCAPRRKGLR